MNYYFKSFIFFCIITFKVVIIVYAEVLIQYGAKALDRQFTYIIPEYLRDNLKVGMKVTIPFGNSKVNGFVINIKEI